MKTRPSPNDKPHSNNRSRSNDQNRRRHRREGQKRLADAGRRRPLGRMGDGPHAPLHPQGPLNSQGPSNMNSQRPAHLPDPSLVTNQVPLDRPDFQRYQIPSNEYGSLTDYGPLNRQGPFGSDTLLYIQPTENDEWLLMAMNQDPMRPRIGVQDVHWAMTRTRCAEIMNKLQKALLGVIVCIRTFDPNLMPIPIGIMYLEKAFDITAPNAMADILKQIFGPDTPIVNNPDTTLMDQSANLSIWLLTEFQELWWGDEAVRWMLKQGFERFFLHRIAMTIPELYPNTINLCYRLRFQREGLARETYMHPDTAVFVGSVQFAMLEHEWQARIWDWEAQLRQSEALDAELPSLT